MLAEPSYTAAAAALAERIQATLANRFGESLIFGEGIDSSATAHQGNPQVERQLG